jgi:hypothetical protein
LETADIILMGDDLRKLPFTIRLSRKTLGIINKTSPFSDHSRMVNLWLAVFADMGSTLIVTLNALRFFGVVSKFGAPSPARILLLLKSGSGVLTVADHGPCQKLRVAKEGAKISSSLFC